MRKIADVDELADQLRQLLSYARSERPSRKRLAAALQTLSERVASESYPVGAWVLLKPHVRHSGVSRGEGVRVTARYRDAMTQTMMYELRSRKGVVSWFSVDDIEGLSPNQSGPKVT